MMAQDSDQTLVAPAKKPPISVSYAIIVALQVLLTDLVLYGFMIPLLGTSLGGYVAGKFNLSAKWEMMLIIVLTFALIYGTYCLLGETSYWKHLFAFDKFYMNLLQIRDVVNCATLLMCMLGLASTLEVLVFSEEGVMLSKSVHVSEGVLYIILKRLCQSLNVGGGFIDTLGFKAPSTDNRLLDASFDEQNEQFGNGALFMLYWAVLTGCMAKMIYFNTLFTYMRAMEIFISMKPMFNDDEDNLDHESSVSVFSTKKNRQSRMQEDFARSIRESD